jgi:succinate dehydrogenase/fumarate reductase flavoprotein subunit
VRIVVAGGGLAGLIAALRAAELGASVVLLEKGDRPGGSFLLSSGYVWSYEDLPTFRREAPGGDAALQKLILDRLGPGLDWLESVGGALLSRETGNPITFGARLDPERTVRALVDRMLEGNREWGVGSRKGGIGLPALDPPHLRGRSPRCGSDRPDAVSGGEILTETAFQALLEDCAGRITGVLARSSGGESEHAADAVILASGGFAANPELVGRHIIRGPGTMPVRAHPRSTGDGLLAALDAGALASAGLDEFYGRNLPALPAVFPPERFVEVSQLYGRYAVAVNARGERYADEGADWSETVLTRATANQPGLYAWYVLDAKGLEGRVRERTAKEMVEKAMSTGGTVIEAVSLTELADRLAASGVPRETFLRTLEEYNAAVAAGREPSPPRSGQAWPLRIPPFVAVKVAPYITHTVGGLAVDAGCRVLREADGRPIPGLYAAGVEVGGVSVGGYTSGLASALVFGRTAAESAVADD